MTRRLKSTATLAYLLTSGLADFKLEDLPRDVQERIKVYIARATGPARQTGAVVKRQRKAAQQLEARSRGAVS